MVVGVTHGTYNPNYLQKLEDPIKDKNIPSLLNLLKARR